MKCPSCGAEFTNNETFCTSCGTRLDGLNQTPTGIPTNETKTITPQPTNTNDKVNGLAVAGFVISLVSFVIYTIVLAPISAILSAVAYTRVQKTGEKGKGIAIAGIVISVVGLILIVLGYATGFFDQ